MDVVIAAGDAPWEGDAIREIDASPVLRLVRRCVDIADLLAVAQAERAAAAIVSPLLPGLDIDAVHQLERAGVRVAALGPDAAQCAERGIGRILHLGALDEIAHDVPDAPVATPGRRAPLVAVWGPAGAPGRSSVALGLAAATAARGVDTVLVDADTYGGSLGQMLGVLDEVSGLVAACRAVNNGKAREVGDHVLEIDPGLRLLTGLPRADMWAQVRPAAFEGVLDHLRSGAELVVVDCGFSLEPGVSAAAARNQTTLQALDQADVVVVVGRPDPVGLARLVRGVHDLAASHPDCTPVVVVNMMRSTLGWSEREVRATVLRLTGIEPLVHLPHDPSGLDLAIVSGRSPRLAAPSSPFVARIEVLASHVLTSVRTPAMVTAPSS